MVSTVGAGDSFAATFMLEYLNGKTIPECLKKAIRSKALERSLEVEIPEEVYDRLQKEMEAQNG